MSSATDSAGGNPRRYSLPLSDAASSVDPTGTTELRQRFRRAMDARWHRLRNLTSDAIAKSDILGLGGVSINSIQYAPLRGAGRVQAFERWFEEGMRQAVTDGEGAWMAPYIAQAYEMGSRRARKLVGDPMRMGDDRSNMLAALTISEMHGVAGTTAQQATRAVAHGLGARQRPEKVARMVADRIKSIGRARSRTVVDYMVVKAFNAAILDTLRAVGVAWVHTIPEHLRGADHLTDAARKTPQQRHSGSGQFRARGQFERKIPQKRHKKSGQFIPFKPKPSGYLIKKAKKEYRQHLALGEDVDVLTAGDDRVCDVCDDIAANGPYAIDTAEGLIPAHPNCRCSFAPASAVEAIGDAGPPDEPRDPHGKWTGGAAALIEAPADKSQYPAHIAALKLPPAWTDVRISQNPNAALQATGKDAKGRTQYVYHQEFRASQSAAKFARITELAQKFDEIAAQNTEAQKSANPELKAHADAMSLIMKMGIRPGSDEDTKAAAKAYGATTLEGRHVTTDGSETRLQFVGKKGVGLDLHVKYEALAKMLTERSQAAGPNGKLFPQIDAASLLAYAHSLDGGGFKTKDFRTYLGTSLAAAMVKTTAAPTTKTAYKKAVKEVAKMVAKTLGNTPTVALQSYIDPRVFADWEKAHGGP